MSEGSLESANLQRLCKAFSRFFWAEVICHLERPSKRGIRLITRDLVRG